MSKVPGIKNRRDKYVNNNRQETYFQAIRFMIERWIWGFSEKDVWFPNEKIVTSIQPLMEAFLAYQTTCGSYLPPEFQTDPSAWILILEKIEEAFYIHKEDIDGERQLEDEEIENIKKGYELFGKYLYYLKDF